jgi:uroporphyrinogen-III synthase
MLTRPQEEAAPFINNFVDTDLEIRCCRVVGFEGLLDRTEAERLRSAWESYDMVVFTSARAVDYVMELVSPASWSRLTVICSGEKTAAAARRAGVPVSFVASRGGRAGVEELLREHPELLSGAAVLLPRSEAADAQLPRWLAERGAHPTDLPLYRPTTDRSPGTVGRVQELLAAPPAAAAFTSPSTVRALHELAGSQAQQFFEATRRCAIGPTTADALREQTGGVEAVAREHTLEGLAQAVRETLGLDAGPPEDPKRSEESKPSAESGLSDEPAPRDEPRRPQDRVARQETPSQKGTEQ